MSLESKRKYWVIVKKVGLIFLNLKSFFSNIKTQFLIFFYKFSHKKNKKDGQFVSASLAGQYADFALIAAFDPPTYSVFRRHYKYSGVVETVSRKEGEKHLKIIREKYNFNNDEINNIISPLSKIGKPKLMKLNGFPFKISISSLRYLKIALDIKNQAGVNIGNIVEIGGGYGGQAFILDKLLNIESYTFFDLWQVNFLIKKFIENSDFKPPYSISSIREESLNLRSKWDFAISNYAFSELSRNLQRIYIQKVLNNSKAGYMLMNNGVNGNFGYINNHSQKELLDLIKNSKIDDLSFLNGNYLLTW